MDTDHRVHELNVILASTGCTDSNIVYNLLPRLTDLPDVAVKAILDPSFRGEDFIHASSTCLAMPNVPRHTTVREVVPEIEQEAAEMCEWGDVLVLAPMDANNLAKMLHGHTDNLLLEILRSWDVSKKILLLPGMSSLMWENPMTKKQLTKIRRKWTHVQVLQPLLWNFEGDKKQIKSWEATDELTHAIRNQVDLMNIGQGLDVSLNPRHAFTDSTGAANHRLPPELWTMILDFTGDWELAQTLRIFTNLHPPPDWTSHMSPHGPSHYMESLELTILRGDLADVKHFINTHSVPRWLSKLCIRLIMRFAMVPLLRHLELKHNDLFWATFGHTFLPDKASSVFGRTEILEFWRTSPSFIKKEYNAEAVDGASRAGFVHVLEWWQQSGLPLKFTEAALEQASSHGHIAVLDWWKAQSTIVDDTNANVDSSKVRLKPGKSICYATQNGQTNVVKWWLQSGIAFPHEDTVTKLASAHGHVDILQLWHDAKGSKMIFDNQVLISATKSANVEVLEWWKRSGLRVEYKMFELEEAFEDGYEGERGNKVKAWWSKNGLNLRVRTSEWMKPQYLNS